MGNTEFRVQYRVYQEGLRARRDAVNPYTTRAEQRSWERGHHDRWIHGVAPDNQPSVKLAVILIAIGLGSVIYTLITTFNRT